jgi:hypothetical protein
MSGLRLSVRERSDETYAAKYISISHPKAGIPMLDSSSDVALHARHAAQESSS